MKIATRILIAAFAILAVFIIYDQHRQLIISAHNERTYQAEIAQLTRQRNYAVDHYFNAPPTRTVPIVIHEAVPVPSSFDVLQMQEAIDEQRSAIDSLRLDLLLGRRH